MNTDILLLNIYYASIQYKDLWSLFDGHCYISLPYFINTYHLLLCIVTTVSHRDTVLNDTNENPYPQAQNFYVANCQWWLTVIDSETSDLAFVFCGSVNSPGLTNIRSKRGGWTEMSGRKEASGGRQTHLQPELKGLFLY